MKDYDIRCDGCGEIVGTGNVEWKDLEVRIECVNCQNEQL